MSAKFRFVQETRPDGDVIYFTEWFSDNGNWLYVSQSLSHDKDRAHDIFVRIKANKHTTSRITVLEE